MKLLLPILLSILPTSLYPLPVNTYQRPAALYPLPVTLYQLPPTPYQLPCTIVSFNIRYDNPADGINAWPQRKSAIASFVKEKNPDFLGIQEGLSHQVKYLDSQLSETHHFIGVGRDHGDERGEYCALFYNFHRYELITMENIPTTVWLSQTPQIPSKGWDAALPRIATIGQFRDLQTGKILLVINTHFDHIGATARQKSMALIYLIITRHQHSFDGVILLGDMNLPPDSKPIKWISKRMRDSYSDQDPRGTFNGFNPLMHALNPGPRIDYIFTSRNLNVTSCSVDYRFRADGPSLGYLSDHYPVMVEINL